MSATAVAIRLRTMTAADLSTVTAIEKASFRRPWSKMMFQDELDQPFSWHRVAVDEAGRVQGYLIGRCYPDVWHLMNLAVEVGARRRGIGRALLEEFLAAAKQAGRSVFLEVRPSNRAAISLYRASGFAVVGVRPRYYSDNQEDALLMACDFALSSDHIRGDEQDG